jgi:alcohol dehydrogenase (cytochrome c)
MSTLFVLLALMLVIGLPAPASEAAAGQPSAGQAGVSGPFTAAQAARGKVVYERSCAACHGTALAGAAAPALVGPSFQARWRHRDATVDDLFYLTRTTMPPRALGTVPAEDHAAAVAYILEANGYEPGTTVMAVGAPGLKQKFAWAGKYVSMTAEPGTHAGPDVVAGDPGAVPGTNGPDQAALTGAAQSTDWLVHTHDYAGTRFSPLDRINTTNAARLAPACMFQVGERDNFQTGPVVHRGTLYLTTSRSTIALDAASCRVKWRHTWVPRGDVVWDRNRGVALKDGRVVRGTPDGFLLALSTETGALLWARRVADSTGGETFTMAPLIFEDLVLIGPAGSEQNIKGWVGAFRLGDGAPVWRFNTVPQPGEPGSETWQNPMNIPMGGGAVWTPFSLDTESGDLHVAVTNPSPDLPAHLRPGDNLYTNSIVVLDVRTGQRRWHRSLVPNDSHDWDLTQVMPLFTASANGVVRRLVATAGKDGMLRTLDRDSHEIVYQTPVTTRENASVPITTTPTRACPGTLGGVEWNGPSFSARTNMLYVPAVDWCATYTAAAEPRYIPGKSYFGGTFEFDPAEKAQGWITALDAATGAVKWKHRSPRPMVAAVTATAGDLLFAGELTGDFLAIDARSGDVLYRFNTGGAIGGGIVTYEAAGRQYVAVASGTPSNFWVEKNAGAPTVIVFGIR